MKYSIITRISYIARMKERVVAMCLGATTLAVTVGGCGDSEDKQDVTPSPAAFARSSYPDQDYLELCDVPWFEGIGKYKDVVTFREQGIITVAPSESEGFVSRIYGVTDVTKKSNGGLRINVIDFQRDPKIGSGEFIITVSPIKNGECLIEFKNHSERFQTATKK